MLTQTLRRTVTFILLLTLILGFSLIAVASPGISVYIDGQRLQTDVDPIIIQGRTMVPMRAIFEALGAAVQWDGDTQQITGTREGTTVVLYLDNPNASINGRSEQLDVLPTLVHGRTLVPTRFIAESLGADVQWDGNARTVIITTGKVANSNSPFDPGQAISLPRPSFTGSVSLEEAIANRKSVRRYAAQPLDTQELSQVLWAAYGTGVDGVTGATRTVPSAGGTYFLEIFVITTALQGNVNVPAGIYQYDWQNHQLLPVTSGDQRRAMAQTSTYGFIENAPLSIIVAVDYQRTTRFRLGKRFAYMETGYVTQNVHLQAEALGLGSVAVAGFDVDQMKALLKTGVEPVIIIPVGKYEAYEHDGD